MSVNSWSDIVTKSPCAQRIQSPTGIRARSPPAQGVEASVLQGDFGPACLEHGSVTLEPRGELFAIIVRACPAQRFDGVFAAVGLHGAQKIILGGMQQIGSTP